MNNEFTTIDTNDLDNVTGGNKGQWLKKGAKWGWDNVVKPAAAWAGFDWAADKVTGGSKPAQPAQGQ